MLRGSFPDGVFPIIEIHTEGDRDKSSPLSVIGGRGAFTSALESALLNEEIDAAVHSAKDLPSTLPDGLTISAFPVREDPRDVLVSRHGMPLAALPANPVIGTSSRRRAFQLRRLRPDARVVELRGNLDTRLRKALADDLDGVILAAAGIARMGWLDRVTQFLPTDEFLPAPGQGALAIETRAAPDPAVQAIARLNDPELSLAVGTERAFLRGVGAGCTSPVGAFAVLSADGKRVSLTAMLANDDGERFERMAESFPVDNAEEGAFALGQRLLTSLTAKPMTPGYQPPPLAGRRVLVTGAGRPADRLVATLRDAGATPVALPLIRIEPSSRPDELRGAIERLASGSYAWLVITSGNAVRALVDARTSDPNLVPPSNLRVAAVGQATAQRLRDARWRVDLVPKDQTAAGLVAAFHGVDLQGQRVLCLLGNLARATLAEGLREQDAIVEVVEAYRTKPVERLSDEVRRLLSDGEIDVVTFASPSAVTAFIDLLGYEEVSMPSAAIACIGPTTRAAAIDHGLSVDVVAPEPSAKAFVTALSAYFAAPNGDHA
jgi:hydroxymethylbilane synthase